MCCYFFISRCLVRALPSRSELERLLASISIRYVDFVVGSKPTTYVLFAFAHLFAPTHVTRLRLLRSKMSEIFGPVMSSNPMPI